MQRFLHASKAILTGLLLSQALSTLHVYLSNIELFDVTAAARKAGYLALPNWQVASSLQDFRPAFLGGLFFTFTAGACLSVLSFAGARLWDRAGSRKKVHLGPLILCWAAVAWSSCSRGFSPMVAAYFLIIPPAVFSLSLKRLPDPAEKTPRPHILIIVVCFSITALVFAHRFGMQTIVAIRDNLLLSNPVGRTANDFYYKYNLYAAQVFKSLDQKTIKTCDLSSIEDSRLAGRLTKELLASDYLTLDRQVSADLKIVKADGALVLMNGKRQVLHTTEKSFFERPGKTLRTFSEKSDRHLFFRRFTFFSILFLAFATVFFGLCGLFYAFSRIFLGPSLSMAAAGILCCAAGLALLLPTHFEKTQHLKPEALAAALASANGFQRVAALKVVVGKNLEINDFPAHRAMLESRRIPERYWLALAMSASQAPGAYTRLLKLLDDPQVNVVCAALYALGKRGDRRAIPRILKVIDTSGWWYIQWYAYRALKDLGWKQAK